MAEAKKPNKFAHVMDDAPVVPLAEQLTALQKTAEQLNAASDRLNNDLQAFEQTLLKANLGLEVWLAYDQGNTLYTYPPELGSWEGQDYTRYVVVELGFAKCSDGWHVAARERAIDAGGVFLHKGPYPLAQASRKDRIAALQLLPHLVQALQAEAAKAIQTIEQAQALVLC